MSTFKYVADSFHFIYFIYLFINPHQDGTIKHS